MDNILHSEMDDVLHSEMITVHYTLINYVFEMRFQSVRHNAI